MPVNISPAMSTNAFCPYWTRVSLSTGLLQRVQNSGLRHLPTGPQVTFWIFSGLRSYPPTAASGRAPEFYEKGETAVYHLLTIGSVPLSFGSSTPMSPRPGTKPISGVHRLLIRTGSGSQVFLNLSVPMPLAYPGISPNDSSGRPPNSWSESGQAAAGTPSPNKAAP